MCELNHSKTLLIGIGNSGRKDDGLGWLLTEKVEDSGLFLGDTVMRYQLQIEDAELISHYDTVIFVDACREKLNNGFELRPCNAAPSFSFTTHEIAPESILHLCQDLYQQSPKAFLLLIEGKEWPLEIGLSPTASTHLEKAWMFLEEEWLKS
jgi:hydrogenase maturation protease